MAPSVRTGGSRHTGLAALPHHNIHLNHGDDYASAKAVIQIGLLDFTLFPERPEFYATYKLINEKNFFVYSNKLRLSVVDLTHIDLATEEDRLYGIDT